MKSTPLMTEKPETFAVFLTPTERALLVRVLKDITESFQAGRQFTDEEFEVIEGLLAEVE